MKRKDFLSSVGLGAVGLITTPMTGFSQDKSKQIPAKKVKEFVTAGHFDFEKTKEMLKETPSLIYATWDWGGGDFETALEGAGHLGNKEIANYLIEMGARTNLFVLTMLGKTEIVKSYLEMYPKYVFAKGPHGFTLLHHADKGGEDAKELFEYLQSKGLKDYQIKL